MHLMEIIRSKLNNNGIKVGVVLVAIIILISIINAAYCSNLKKVLVGKSFEGGDYGYIDFEIGITFIDKERLNFDFHESWDESILGPAMSIKRNYKNVPYKIRNGFFVLK